MINKIDLTPYPITNVQTVYTAEGNTTLELVGIVAKKTNDCVEIVNGVDALATQAQQVVQNMQVAQDEFIVSNNDARTQIVTENAEFVDSLTTSKTLFESELTTSKETFESSLTTEKNLFESEINTSIDNFESDIEASKLLFETTMSTSNTNFENNLVIEKNAFVENLNAEIDLLITNSNVLIQTNVNEKINTMLTDGTIENLIDDVIIGEVRADIVAQELYSSEATGIGIINGLKVLQQASPDMSVLISSGVAHIYNGKRYNQTENAVIVIDAPNALFDRIDIIYINSSNVLTYGKGEASITPIAPIPVNGAILAEISVSKTTTIIALGNITDKRRIKTSVTEIVEDIGLIDSQLTEIAKRINIITPEMFGAIGDGVADDTIPLQNAFIASAGKMIRFDNKTYLIELPNATGLSIESNTTVELQPNTIVKFKPSLLDSYTIFDIIDAENVTFIGNGGKLQGDKDEHLGTTGEWGFGFKLRNCKNVTIDNVSIIDMWGDGIFIAKTNTGTDVCENVIIKNIKINNCRRQGVSITNGKNMILKDLTITNIGGTQPEAAIDFESDFENATFEHIIVDNLFCDNVGDGILFNKSKSGIWEDIIIKNSVINGRVSISINTDGYVQDIKLKNNIINNTGSAYTLEMTGNIYSVYVEDCKITGGSEGFSMYGTPTISPEIISLKNCNFENQGTYSIHIRDYVVNNGRVYCNNVGCGNTPSHTNTVVDPFHFRGISNLIMIGCYEYGGITTSNDNLALTAISDNIMKHDIGKNYQSDDVRIRKNGGGLYLYTPDGTKIYKISLDNTGAIVATLKSFLYS